MNGLRLKRYAYMHYYGMSWTQYKRMMGILKIPKWAVRYELVGLFVNKKREIAARLQAMS
jgi:hypothetical protein